MGGLYLEQKVDTTVVRYVTKIIPHPDYDPYTLENDLAILILEEAVTKNVAIQPIALNQNNTANGTSCTITGWGTTVFVSNKNKHKLKLAF